MGSNKDHQQPLCSTDAGSESGSVHSTRMRSTNDLGPTPNEPPLRRQQVPNTVAGTPAVPSLPDESTIRAAPALPKIRPFYAIVSDATLHHPSPDTYYPRVRYVFNDDGPDLLSSALAGQQSLHERRHPDKHDASASSASRSVPESGHPDRAVLLDLVLKPGGQGYSVGSATSLSSDWAVLDSHLNRLGGGRPGLLADSTEDETLLLEVEGISVPAEFASGTGPNALLGDNKPRPTHTEGNRAQAEEYSALIGDFDKRMSLLRRIVHNSEQRRSRFSPPEAGQDTYNLHLPDANASAG